MPLVYNKIDNNPDNDMITEISKTKECLNSFKANVRLRTEVIAIISKNTSTWWKIFFPQK